MCRKINKFRQTLSIFKEGVRTAVSGRVGNLLFRTHSQQRARASRGQTEMLLIVSSESSLFNHPSRNAEISFLDMRECMERKFINSSFLAMD